MNNLRLNETFKAVREFLSSMVPPCVVTLDQPHVYEIWAVNGDKKTFFASINEHTHSATLQFNEEIPEKDAKQIFSAYLLQKMNQHRRIDIHEWADQSRKDFQDCIQSLARYYQEKKWLA